MANAASTKEVNLLEIRYLLLPELVDKLLSTNPKLHDIGKIVESILRYGFRDPLAIDTTLNGGTGGIAEGNGRLEALLHLFKEDPTAPPDYIKLTTDGNWAIPCIVGGNSITESEGLAYSLDHNSLTMAGGTFTALDVSGLYDRDGYTNLLEGLAASKALPVMVDGDDLDLLVTLGDNPPEFNRQPPEKISPPCPNCGYVAER